MLNARSRVSGRESWSFTFIELGFYTTAPGKQFLVNNALVKSKAVERKFKRHALSGSRPVHTVLSLRLCEQAV